jgi:Zn-dependent metalloprotease
MKLRNGVLDLLLPLTGAAGLMLAASCDSADEPLPTSSDDSALAAAMARPDVARAVQTGRDLLLQARGKMALDADHDFVTRNAVVDEQGGTHVRYDQTYRGVRVWGGEAIVHEGASQRAAELTSDLKRGIKVGTVPALSAADAVKVAERDLRPMGSYAHDPTAELIIYPHVREQVRADAPQRDTGLNAVDMERVVTGYSLAYYVQTALENGAPETRHTDYIIDAHSGKILAQWDSLQTAAATGTANTQYSGSKTINVNSVTSGWELRDVVSGMNYATYNLNHSTSGTGSIYTDADNTWGDGANYVEGSSTTAANGQTAGVDAHFGVGATWAYYNNVLGRNGIDGAGKATYSRVHYSNSYDNAFWDDNCFCMTYGDGSSFTTLTSIDVAGHEMAHGVTSRTAGLTYSGESGGLNESFSDINGTMVEFYSRGGSGSTIGNTGGTWTIGEQLATNPLRYMYKPSKDGSSKDAWYSGLGSIDVHYSSGPSNRMFYFLSQGASSTAGSDYYSTYRPCGMTGIGNDKAARIAYRALSVYMNSSTNYAAARTAYLNAASDLYGGTASAEYAAVQNAFGAINVGTGTSCSTTPTISTNPTSMSFSGPPGGANPASQTLAITNSGGGTLTWTASSSQTWLTLSATSGTGPSSVTVSVNTAGMAAGTYNATITITATGATNSPYTVPVTLNIGTCTGGGNLLLNPGFESGAVSWSATAGVIGASNARTGTWAAWLDGYGSAHTDTLSQTVTNTACTAATQLCFYLKINTSEIFPISAYDKLTVKVNGTTLGTLSNLDSGTYASYVQKCYSVNVAPGASAAVLFTGTEDGSLQTSFFVDDTSLQ